MFSYLTVAGQRPAVPVSKLAGIPRWEGIQNETSPDDPSGLVHSLQENSKNLRLADGYSTAATEWGVRGRRFRR